MQWIGDHLVLVAGAVATALVLGGLAFLGIVGIRAWRLGRRAITDTGAQAQALMSRAEALQGKSAALSARTEDLAEARTGLDRQLAVAKVIGEHLGRALAILRAPLRALGR